MRQKTITTGYYRKAQKAIERNMSNGIVRHYVLTHRGKVVGHLMRLDDYLAMQRRIELNQVWGEALQRYREAGITDSDLQGESE